MADALANAYGRPRRRQSDPLDDLIGTVLSQNTSDVNSGRAFAALKARYPTWDAAARARRSAIEATIRSGGLARLKSARILEILAAVGEREGRLDLRRLRSLSREDAEEQLRGLPGVGPKTRACVLLFACGHDAFPVDTHVHRIVRRLGLVPTTASAERTHEILEPVIPEGRALDLHLNLIRLGRTLCRPQAPQCSVCPLRRHCAHAKSAA